MNKKEKYYKIIMDDLIGKTNIILKRRDDGMFNKWSYHCDLSYVNYTFDFHHSTQPVFKHDVKKILYVKYGVSDKDFNVIFDDYIKTIRESNPRIGLQLTG